MRNNRLINSGGKMQSDLFDQQHNRYDTNLDFNSKYFVSHLITYIGNKRKLLPFIDNTVEKVKHNLHKDKMY